MKKETLEELLEFILYNSDLSDIQIFEMVSVLIRYIENKCCGYEDDVRRQTLKRVIKPLFEMYISDWIASYDDLDLLIDYYKSYRKR
jgi:hypothetical protein